MAFTLAVSVVFFVWNDRLIALFTDDAAVIAIGGEWLSILSYSYFVYGWWMVNHQRSRAQHDRHPTPCGIAADILRGSLKRFGAGEFSKAQTTLA